MKTRKRSRNPQPLQHQVNLGHLHFTFEVKLMQEAMILLIVTCENVHSLQSHRSRHCRVLTPLVAQL